MDFAFKILYYATQTIACLMVGFFFLAAVFGGTGANRIVALGSGLLSFAALGVGVYLGHFCDRWLAGTAVAALGVIVFFVAMILGSLLFTNVHWQ